MTDRNEFLKLVRNESKRFRPLGKFISEFTRQIDVGKPESIFGNLEPTKKPKRELKPSSSNV